MPKDSIWRSIVVTASLALAVSGCGWFGGGGTHKGEEAWMKRDEAGGIVYRDTVESPGEGAVQQPPQRAAVRSVPPTPPPASPPAAVVERKSAVKKPEASTLRSSSPKQEKKKSHSKQAAAGQSSGKTAAGSKAKADSAVVKTRKGRAASMSELVRKYPQAFFISGPQNGGPYAALTFDDAPDGTFTPQVLDILKKYGVKATFFLVGYRAEKYPQLVKRMVSEGHIVGNHSYNHANFPKLSDAKYAAEIDQTQKVLKRVAGYEPKLLRPPYGAITEEQAKWAIDRNMAIVGWNVDSLDWKQLGKDEVLHNIFKDVRAGCIILQHSGGGVGQDLSGTVKALPSVIEKLRGQGYTLVTVPELLHVPKEKLTPLGL